MEECIQDFIEILTEANNRCNSWNLSDETIDRIGKLVTEDNNLLILIHNLSEIDEETTNISLITKIIVYDYLFSKDFYEKIKNGLDLEIKENEKYNFFKCLVSGGILCELIKINICDNAIKIDTTDNPYKNTIKAVQSVFTQYKENSLSFVKQLCDDAKQYFEEDEEYTEIIKIVDDNKDML